MPFDSDIREALRPPGPAVDLGTIDPRGLVGHDGDKDRAEDELVQVGEELADLQERLFAHRGDAAARSVLLVLQGMDTSGKGGVIRHAVGLVDPQGVRITSFKAPTQEELAHDFLWRIRKGIPDAGYLGVFDRSHYEDVLIGRVRALASPDELERRYDAINAFEQELVERGVVIVKCMLHISPDEQKERLLARLENPDKHWKFNPGDIDERAQWGAYREAYEIALTRTHTEHAPWHVVPSDRKWLRNLAVAQLLLETFRDLDLGWPPADFDVEEQLERLKEEDPIG
ncbi:PPK2 family polyphosphate kinase [Nocardioides alcanivorans]|uniref:PPK2 family polyphosphate kinase n=1 Tax=Nocardioides alcanivorans TaxID=2897352 RepID=UPI001F47C85A|nr:PPK2 family polyphosphate kinase [Nocardioides alcanivorans]